MATADDDGVVSLALSVMRASARGSKNGSLRTTRVGALPMVLDGDLDLARAVPGAKCGAATCASARYFLSSGDQQPLVA